MGQPSITVLLLETSRDTTLVNLKDNGLQSVYGCAPFAAGIRKS